MKGVSCNDRWVDETFDLLKTIKQQNQMRSGDADKVFKGFFAILRYGISKDKISLGLSFFSTTSPVVRPGHNCTYDISYLQYLRTKCLGEITL